MKFPIWHTFSEVEERLLNQLFSIVKEAITDYDSKGETIKLNEEKWKNLHNGLSRELGVDQLFPRYYSYVSKQSTPVSGFFSWSYVCGEFVKSNFPSDYLDADRFIKERISFIELAMRYRYQEIEALNLDLTINLHKAKIRDSQTFLGVNIADRINVLNKNKNDIYSSQVDEINERFRRLGAPVTLHNGFIQVSNDEMIERNIAQPFWDLVADPLWKNVDIDMKEALDRRDSNDKDPALFAAKALESTIKIISDRKGWFTGKENGASNYIDNLVSKKNGRYIDSWEADILKDYFRKVRNPLGHGPGSDPMPILSTPQTDWAIEASMSWVRTLIRRLL